MITVASYDHPHHRQTLAHVIKGAQQTAAAAGMPVVVVYGGLAIVVSPTGPARGYGARGLRTG